MIGIVHGNPFFNLPDFKTLSKSSFPIKPSNGLKIPSPIFSISFLRLSSISRKTYPWYCYFLIQKSYLQVDRHVAPEFFLEYYF
jgi:hypothetical protein